MAAWECLRPIVGRIGPTRPRPSGPASASPSALGDRLPVVRIPCPKARHASCELLRLPQESRAPRSWVKEESETMSPEHPNRRDFLHAGAAGVAAAALAGAAEPAKTNAGGVPLRPFGR